MIDILDFDPIDDYAAGELVRCLAGRLKPTEVEDLMFVLGAWDRSLTDVDRLQLERYEAARRRGRLSPNLVRSHLITVARLSRTPEWRAVLRWRKRIHEFDPVEVKSARKRKAA